MSATTIILNVVRGNCPPGQFTFEYPVPCLIGRARDCDVCLDDPTVSRHHCLIAVSATAVRIRDLHSLNGTRVNSCLIGKRLPRPSSDTTLPNVGDEQELRSGDEIRVGKTVFRIDIRKPEMPEVRLAIRGAPEVPAGPRERESPRDMTERLPRLGANVRTRVPLSRG